jgi:hypothetical protein
MWKVSVKNILTNQEYGAQYETEALADAFISEQVASNGWGLPAREIKKGGEYNPVLFDSEYEKEVTPSYVIDLFESDSDGDFALDQFGNKIKIGTKVMPAVTETWVKLKPEYTIEKVDITAEVNGEEEIKQAKAARAFGYGLYDDVATLVLIHNTKEAALGNTLTTQQMLDLLSTSTNLEKALKEAAFGTAIYILNGLKVSLPQYTTIADWALAKIVDSEYYE